MAGCVQKTAAPTDVLERRSSQLPKARASFWGRSQPQAREAGSRRHLRVSARAPVGASVARHRTDGWMAGWLGGVAGRLSIGKSWQGEPVSAGARLQRWLRQGKGWLSAQHSLTVRAWPSCAFRSSQRFLLHQQLHRQFFETGRACCDKNCELGRSFLPLLRLPHDFPQNPTSKTRRTRQPRDTPLPDSQPPGRRIGRPRSLAPATPLVATPARVRGRSLVVHNDHALKYVCALRYFPLLSSGT